MINLLLLPFLINSFVQKEYIEYGTSGPNGRVLLDDYNRNGKVDIIFTGYIDIFALGMVLERQDSAIYLMVDTVGFYLAIWDDGDFDSDGLYDVVTDGDYFIGMMIFESPDSFSYPTQEVWWDTVGFPLVTPICTYDIDQDGFPEIVKVCGYYTDLDIYESIGDNLYEKIAEITTASTHTPSSTLAFGDFDLDGQNEFVWGYTGGEYSIFECIGNNSYQETSLQNLSTLNIKDCFSVPDADGDGKMEFVIKGYWVYGTIDAFIFEAIGDNTYEIIKTFTLPGGDYYGGYSDAGDVDGDSIPEIVLEARQNVFIIKADGNDSFYVWDTLPGHASGSSIAVYDIDENGLAEIVISGNNETRIYEYDPGGMEEARSRKPEARLKVYPNPFSKLTKISFGKGHGAKDIELKIYDVSGRLVKDFSHLTLDAQRPSLLSWHGDDENGRVVSDGVYFVQVRNRHTGATICEKVLKVR